MFHKLVKMALAAPLMLTQTLALSITYDIDENISGVFDEAHKLWDQRGESFVKATEASNKYRELLKLPAVKKDEDLRIYGTSRALRLDLYRGAMIEGVSEDDQKDALDSCIDLADTIENVSKGKEQPYYYYKMACIGFRGKISNIIKRAAYGIQISGLQNDAIQSSTDVNGKQYGGYEGGGIFRVLSALRGNQATKALKLYDPEEGLKFSNIAIQTAKEAYSAFPSKKSGKDYPENYYYSAQAYLSLASEKGNWDHVDTAYSTISDSIETIDQQIANNTFDKKRAPETGYYLRMMKKIASTIEVCAEENEEASDEEAIQCIVDKI